MVGTRWTYQQTLCKIIYIKINQKYYCQDHPLNQFDHDF